VPEADKVSSSGKVVLLLVDKSRMVKLAGSRVCCVSAWIDADAGATGRRQVSCGPGRLETKRLSFALFYS